MSVIGCKSEVNVHAVIRHFNASAGELMALRAAGIEQEDHFNQLGRVLSPTPFTSYDRPAGSNTPENYDLNEVTPVK